MKLIQSLAASVLFVALLVLTYAVHIRFFRVDVVFYAALGDAVIAAAATALFLMTSLFRRLGGFEKWLLFVIWLLAGYAAAISVPTVIDRSLSFYILEKLQQRGGGIRQDAFAQVFTQEYVKEHRLVDVRLTEQLASGTIDIRDGCVQLTPKGERLAHFSRYFRAHWLPHQRLLMGQYADDLTDPFRHSEAITDYRCQARPEVPANRADGAAGSGG
ncbi:MULTISPECIES: hypothetical protein [Hydrogenophaga]|uniref:DUF4760 domain-containing protein n=1 Tax=Hydrogenophaga electricum TaxID=1230953 RepID=A0ABQ6BZQ8_9BURK|nr:MULTISPECIES: hypothetical protein [Hydrogenophaga]GLS13207.1 hypothetical protein GCM10007935_06360 [Hydrogenophaga electricum]